MGHLIPMMTPAPGERVQKFVGDCMAFSLTVPEGASAEGWQARLRTNIGRAELLRREIVDAHTNSLPIAGASWRDLPMRRTDTGWSIELPLAEAGFFKAKAYLLDPQGWQHWPEGGDAGISVHPDSYRTANILYCAFPRLFGPTRAMVSTENPRLEAQIEQIENHGFAILPPSGKLRDLAQALPHILEVLGCRIVHLLPVNPTPATYARFGRFGSPYAALDLTAIDPALVVFDKKTTGVDQFRELAYATHLRGGRLFIDIVINHTGWGSMLQENHPEWFLRHSDGTFASPGAWGVTWEDLVELKHDNVALWDQLADMFLTWCRRGVDGFRCDAGYKVPLPAWQYIIARVQQEFPATVFLLEGLGGSWEATEALLTEGGMQWAYSELFQNYSGAQVAGYLDYALRQSGRVGLYVHYSETHDNNRLAAFGQAAAGDSAPNRQWSLLRNRLCALASISGGFGFTCGVEWLATEKIRVHGSTGLAWGGRENIVTELARLNRLLADHPCFFDGARVKRLSSADSSVCALLRESAEGADRLLVLANTDCDKEQAIVLNDLEPEAFRFELLGQSLPSVELANGAMTFRLEAGAVHCLGAGGAPIGGSGPAYRAQRARAAFGMQALHCMFPTASVAACSWRELAAMVDESPFRFLASISSLESPPDVVSLDLLQRIRLQSACPRVIAWSPADRRRVTPVPSGHWLLLEDESPFRASLLWNGGESRTPEHAESVAAGGKHVACFAPRQLAADARLAVERYADEDRAVEAAVRFLADEPAGRGVRRLPPPEAIVLLTNGIGGMARVCVDLGRVRSKYDCVLGANLHPSLPVDRHVFVKRIRVWVVADGFISPLNYQQLAAFHEGPQPEWQFIANAGDGRTVQLAVTAAMKPGENTTVFQFRRPSAARAAGKQLPPGADVRLTVRVDIEDRNFHSETRRNGGAEHHFASNTRTLEHEGTPARGFVFAPAEDRELRVFTDQGRYHAQPEWSEGIAHPIEASRGQAGSGDAFSPGWFELPMPKGNMIELRVTAEREAVFEIPMDEPRAETASPESWEERLHRAAREFVVRRGNGKTVIAGYPWFLDWGRDTFICARGLISAGMRAEVEQILVTFARFEDRGTLPNTIHGGDASNRDTSDAPLWFGVVCEELAEAQGSDGLYGARVDNSGRTIRDILVSIAKHYVSGTPNGIRMDEQSGLIWSPSHFTWMDTNYPAGTPREGYPVEIQALWIRLLRQLARLSEAQDAERWNAVAARALESIDSLFWLEERGWHADVLLGPSGRRARECDVSDALRSNMLFLVTLGIVSGDRAQRAVSAAQRHLVVPGGLRSLAPLPVTVPLPVHGNSGGLLNNPREPYWGRYAGDEDTQRKPAYHNGTAWTWTFPVFCEALARAWEFAPAAAAAARGYLGSMDYLTRTGCIGHIPEVLDGDAPHTPRGCDAQAWGATEALRVWKLLAAAGRK